MRYVTLFALLLLPSSALAENWVRAVEIQAGMVRGFQLQADCTNGGFACIEIGSERPDEITINDLGEGSYSFSVNTTAKNERLAEEASKASELERLQELAEKGSLSDAEQQEAILLMLKR